MEYSVGVFRTPPVTVKCEATSPVQYLAPSPTTLYACADQARRNGYGSNVGASRDRQLSSPVGRAETPSMQSELPARLDHYRLPREDKRKSPHCPPDLPQYTHGYIRSFIETAESEWGRGRSHQRRSACGSDIIVCPHAHKSYLSTNEMKLFIDKFFYPNR